MSKPVSLKGIWAAVIVTATLGLAASVTAQVQEEEQVYLPDLGIIIEPDQDSVIAPGLLPAGEDVELTVGKEPPGAAFIESTNELRAVLDDLSGKINDLESSLNEDVESVRIENERLRALIRKIQSTRKETEVVQALESTSSESPPVVEVKPLSAPPVSNYRDMFKAYREGLFEEVIILYSVLDKSGLGPEENTQVAYWLADANYRLGRYSEALEILDGIPLSGHELIDDTIVLQGLTYLRQGRSQEARERFQTIINQYPASDYHRLAVLTIKELNQL
ncbi:MAG: tetratricopeptide repeat protein [Fidelibacterota bacterium]|nr:MAG: tetratricopeptide repeat protein [Candidatus Neomarinimicrobiota bacterium]